MADLVFDWINEQLNKLVDAYCGKPADENTPITYDELDKELARLFHLFRHETATSRKELNREESWIKLLNIRAKRSLPPDKLETWRKRYAALLEVFSEYEGRSWEKKGWNW